MAAKMKAGGKRMSEHTIDELRTAADRNGKVSQKARNELDKRGMKHNEIS